jgi:hypothetical protein
VTGIVDWSQSRDEDLVALDLVFWMLTVPARGQPHSFGARVAAAMNQCWTPAEGRLIGPAMDGDAISKRTLVLLAWLRHVSDNLQKSDRYQGSLVWSRRNIAPVLRLVAHD